MFKSKPTSRGNVGYSYISQEEANKLAEAMDKNNCINCTNCHDCRNCSDCTNCRNCTNCKGILKWNGEKEVKNLLSINGLYWPVTTDGNFIQIGCQFHSVERWEGFSDALISKMDVDALDFWRQFKPTIMAMAAYKKGIS